jgi:hypothetical protein
MRVSQPVALLERPGELQARPSHGEVHLAGDADVLTRERFRDAIQLVLQSGLRPAPGGRVLVDARTLRHLGAARIGRLVLDELAEDR